MTPEIDGRVSTLTAGDIDKRDHSGHEWSAYRIAFISAFVSTMDGTLGDLTKL